MNFLDQCWTLPEDNWGLGHALVQPLHGEEGGGVGLLERNTWPGDYCSSNIVSQQKLSCPSTRNNILPYRVNIWRGAGYDIAPLTRPLRYASPQRPTVVQGMICGYKPGVQTRRYRGGKNCSQHILKQKISEGFSNTMQIKSIYKR